MGKARIRDYSARLCVVTGAASGIGRAVALELARRGAVLAICDRDTEALDATAKLCAELSGKEPFATAFDLASIEETRDFARRVQEILGTPEVVLHVGGISMWGAVEKMSHDEWKLLVDVNLMGSIHIVESFVPQMIEAHKPAALALVSSAAGLIGMPWHAAYSASKFGVRGIAEVLRFDLAPAKISVHLVTPGAVDTPLVQKIKISGVDTSNRAVSAAQSRFSRHAVSPEVAALKMINGVAKGKYLIHTSRDIAFLCAAQCYFPPIYLGTMRLLNMYVLRVAKEAEVEAG